MTAGCMVNPAPPASAAPPTISDLAQGVIGDLFDGLADERLDQQRLRFLLGRPRARR